MLFAGCTGLYTGIYSSQEISTQEAIISSNMNSTVKLLEFQEQARLGSFKPNYQNYSAEIDAACQKINALDENKKSVSRDAKIICENKKGIDKCFFQVEKIKTQLKNKDANINLDNIDVLCSDLRSLGLQANLDSFKSQYKGYGAWLNGEDDILAKWNAISTFFSNTSPGSQLSGAKMSDYYKDYKDGMAKVGTSLQDIKSACALKNGFKSTRDKVETICNNVGDYISDLDKVNAIVFDTFNFFGQFESSTVTIDSAFVKDCNQVNKEYAVLYGLKLVQDTQSEDANKTDFASMCGSFENLSKIYSNLGIPLIFEKGELSSTTKTELVKAKTVYVDTDSAIGSGVLLSSDSSGYYILTNAHVALEYDPYTGSKYLPSYVRVKFYDGKIGYATQLGYTQEGYDLVLLYVPSSSSYPTASYETNYYPNAGDKVVAVGNPYGLEFSVSQGTVSGIRDMGCLTDYCYGTVIQTDTSINPGNSGGGLWDYSTGNLIGINSLGLTKAQGLNFAISMYQYEKIKDTFKWYSVD